MLQQLFNRQMPNGMTLGQMLFTNTGGTPQVEPMASEPVPMSANNKPQQPQFANQQQMPNTIGQSLQPNFGGGMMGQSQLNNMGQQPMQQIGYNQSMPMMQEEEQRRRQSIEYAGY